MSKQFSAIGKELRDLILLWDPKLRSLSVDTVSGPVNSQNRTNRHYIHVIDQIDNRRLGAIWVSALNEKVSLESMVLDFPRHFKLHLAEIEDLI